ncbi:MAG: hypothetical protein AAF297_04460 [Planctomycetota bacterium]
MSEPKGAARRASRAHEKAKLVSTPLPSHHKAPRGTSRPATRRVATYAASLGSRILNFIRSRSSYGATDAELYAHFRLNGESTIRPRRIALRDRGAIIDSGKRRKTAKGNAATVWIAAEFAEPEGTGR